MSDDDKQGLVIICHVLLFISFQIIGWSAWSGKENDILAVIAMLLLFPSIIGIIAFTVGNPGDHSPKQRGESWNQAAGRQGRGGWGAGSTIMINLFLSIALVMLLTWNTIGLIIFASFAYGIYLGMDV
jgi:hypothetical protein